MLSKISKILKFSQYQKFDKASFIIYADLECIIEKIDGCKYNPTNFLGILGRAHKEDY